LINNMGKDSLRSSIQTKEALVKGENPDDYIVAGANSLELVSEQDVYDAISTFEQKLNTSALGASPQGKKFKEKIERKLTESTASWEKRISQFRAKKGEKFESKFKELFAKILYEAKSFEKKEGVREIFEAIIPLYENKEAVKKIINLKSYKKNSGHWKKMNGELALLGFDEKSIKEIQKIIGAKPDGKVGPETITKINDKVFGEQKTIEWSNETHHEEESAEDFGLGFLEFEKVMDDQQWRIIVDQESKDLAALDKRKPQTVSDIEAQESERADN